MRLLFYSSPYKYYMENLEPLVDLAIKSGDTVYKRFSILPEKDIKSLTVDEHNITIYELISKRMIDAVVIVQPWWYADKEVAGACNRYKVPFYIVDHAPPMMPYTESSGKKSHLYRANLFNAKAFFSYGNATNEVMTLRGCREKIIVTGSPRIERMIENYNLFKKDKEFKTFILFDTSNKMEDPNLIKEVKKVQKSLGGDWKMFIKRHSRSPNVFNKLTGVGTLEGPEEQIIYFADVVGFTFPSSAMLLPAIMNKEIVGLYRNHFCREARDYYKKYEGIINEKVGARTQPFAEFINDNYDLSGSPKQKILKYIRKNS
jgi:hypothetical protein